MTLTPTGYKSRLMERQLNEYLKFSGAVSLEGPKWSGKTWMALNQANSSFMLADTNEFGISNKEIAMTDIRRALTGDAPHLIDEWQDFPTIWDTVRSDIDRNQHFGQYILTGSSVPKKDRPKHSGAGRINTLQIRTMSLYEMGRSTGEISVRDMFEGRDIGGKCSPSYEDLVETVLRGGWPGITGLNLEECQGSIAAYIERHIEEASMMDGIRRNKSMLKAVLRSLARNESTLANMTRIQEDTGIPLDKEGPLIGNEKVTEKGPSRISYNTLLDYVDVFDRMHLLEDQQPFHPVLRSALKVGKAVKHHLADPSLTASLLGAGKDRLMNDPNTFGFLFEAMCERDLDVYMRSIGGRIYHYHDYGDREIDAVVELPDGRWGAVEVKLGWKQVDSAAENLLKIKKVLTDKEVEPKPSFLCVVCGLCDTAYRRADGVYVVPINMLGA